MQIVQRKKQQLRNLQNKLKRPVHSTNTKYFDTVTGTKSSVTGFCPREAAESPLRNWPTFYLRDNHVETNQTTGQLLGSAVVEVESEWANTVILNSGLEKPNSHHW